MAKKPLHPKLQENVDRLRRGEQLASAKRKPLPQNPKIRSKKK